MRHLTTLGLAILATACAGGSGKTTQAPAPAAAPQPQAPAPAAQEVMRQAAAAEPPKPKDIDPTGNYNASLTYGGQPINVYLQLWKKEDGSGYAGSLSAEGIPTIPLSSIKVSGKTVTANLASPDGSAVTMEFAIDGNTLAGSWRSSAGDGSAISGKRAP
jgi:hypothetical protein